MIVGAVIAFVMPFETETVTGDIIRFIDNGLVYTVTENITRTVISFLGSGVAIAGLIFGVICIGIDTHIADSENKKSSTEETD